MPDFIFQEIEGLFRPFGLVASVAITKDPVTGVSTGCGTVEMDNESDAQSAINRLNFSQFGGRTIGVSRKRSPQIVQLSVGALVTARKSNGM